MAVSSPQESSPPREDPGSILGQPTCFSFHPWETVDCHGNPHHPPKDPDHQRWERQSYLLIPWFVGPDRMRAVCVHVCVQYLSKVSKETDNCGYQKRIQCWKMRRTLFFVLYSLSLLSVVSNKLLNK